jgi:hypothetical protein
MSRLTRPRPWRLLVEDSTKPMPSSPIVRTAPVALRVRATRIAPARPGKAWMYAFEMILGDDDASMPARSLNRGRAEDERTRLLSSRPQARPQRRRDHGRGRGEAPRGAFNESGTLRFHNPLRIHGGRQSAPRKLPLRAILCRSLAMLKGKCPARCRPQNAGVDHAGRQPRTPLIVLIVWTTTNATLARSRHFASSRAAISERKMRGNT